MKANIYRASTAQSAMRKEIRRAISESMKNMESDILALFLFEMHEQYGFGAVKLRRFAERMLPRYDELRAFYGVDSDDDLRSVAYNRLKQIGLDVDEIGNVAKIKYEVHK